VVSVQTNGFSQAVQQERFEFGVGIPEVNFSSPIQPSPEVSDFVEAIWDWDVPDGETARGLTIKVPPSTAPYFVVQYGTPTHCRWRFGEDSYDHTSYSHVLTQTQSGTFAICPRGPLGVITVRLKPEGATRLARVAMHELTNVKIGLRNIFKDREIAELEEQVMEAGGSRERIACVERFLLRSLREDRDDPVFSHASLQLRRNPGLRMEQLASLLGISKRHLSRGFRAAYGTSPKQYARLARVEKVVDARRRGLGWADVAYACGFTDQAHLINDFGAIVGRTPAEFFGPTPPLDFHRARAAAQYSPFIPFMS
jgi:AraC-like DNA-binding protein